jgi:hypothetical protein
MISKKTLKDYEFNYIEDYFSYIVDSQINGNNQQVKDLFKKLSNEQKNLFMDYLQNDLSYKFNLGRLY